MVARRVATHPLPLATPAGIVTTVLCVPALLVVTLALGS